MDAAKLNKDRNIVCCQTKGVINYSFGLTTDYIPAFEIEHFDTGSQISQASKTFGKFFSSYSELLSKFVEILFQEYVLKDSQSVFYGGLVGIENNSTPSTSKVWPSDHREDFRFCAWSFYSPVQIFPRTLQTDEQGDGDY